MKNVLKIYIRICLFIFPVVFLPMVTDSFVFGKQWFLMVSALLGLLLWGIVLMIDKKVVVRVNGVLWWFLGLTVWSLISWLRLSTGARVRSLMQPLGFGTVVALLIWVFLWLQVKGKEEWRKQLSFLTVSAMLVILGSLLVFLLPDSRLPFSWPRENPLVLVGKGWSLTGSLLMELVLLLFLLMVNGRDLVRKLKDGDVVSGYLPDTVKVALLMLGVCLSGYRLLRLGFGWLDLESSWIIAVETFKNFPIFGIGIGDFVKAFNFFRPASYNLTKFWNSVFVVSGIGVLHVWTELGLVGLMLVLFGGSKLLKKKKNFVSSRGGLRWYLFWLLFGLFLVAVLLPLNLISLWLLVLVLVNNWSGVKKVRIDLFLGEERRNAVLFSLLFFVLMSAGGGIYYSGKFLLSEIYLKKSFVFVSKNNGGEAYNWQIKAIAMNPNLPKLRKTYSQTNLALARSLSERVDDLTEEERQKVSILTQQAVREAKMAVNLDNRDADSWMNLAGIYRQLIGGVDGVADWAYDSYNQAVLLDPVNSGLKLDLGGLLFAAEKYEEADRMFEQAVLEKRDFANGWYNWAYSAKRLNKLTIAVMRMNQVLALVPVDLADYEKAEETLNEWRDELEKLTEQERAKEEAFVSQKKEEVAEEILTTPMPLPTVREEEIVDVLEEDFEPPENVTGLNPSPTAIE